MEITSTGTNTTLGTGFAPTYTITTTPPPPEDARLAKVLEREVRERLHVTGPRAGLVVRGASGSFAEERRATFEVRTDGDSLGLAGYASVTDHAYDVAGGPPNGFTETIERGSFAKSLAERDDVRFLINHDGLPVARTASGTMRLSEDATGLLVEVDNLDRNNPTVAELASAIERGDVDQMSFAFRVMRQEWNDDYTERTIREVKLYDVSAVSFPANPATVIGLRSSSNPHQIGRDSGLPLSLARAQRAALSLHR